MAEHDAFISYSHDDKKFANWLLYELEDVGFKIFLYETDLKAGKSWRDQLGDAIQESLCLLYLMSEKSNNSDWCKNEISHAQNKKIDIIPVKLSPSVEPNFEIAGLHHVDFSSRSKTKRKESLKKLIDTIKSLQEKVDGAEPPPKTDDIERAKLLKIIEDPSKTAEERADAGIKLAGIGDTRPGVGLNEKGIPAIEWMEISEYESISEYPVTVMQFQAFVDAEDGYKDDRWWTAAKKHDRRPDKVQVLKTEYAHSNFPRTYVTWYEALAFCYWLQSKLDESGEIEIRLPTKEQLEILTATPSGEGNYGNTLPSGLGKLCSVGIYPKDKALSGAMDVRGNVLSWCPNHASYPNNIEIALGKDETDDRVVVGGSWGSDSSNIDSVGIRESTLGHPGVGFRICKLAHFLRMDSKVESELLKGAPDLDDDLNIDREHKFWKNLEKHGATLKGDARNWPVQFGPKYGAITFEVRKGYTSAGLKHIDAGGRTLRQVFLAGDEDPFWEENGLPGVPILWGIAVIVYHIDSENNPQVVLGIKGTRPTDRSNPTFVDQLTPPASIMRRDKYGLGATGTLQERMKIGALANLMKQTSLKEADVEFKEIQLYLDVERYKHQAFVVFKLINSSSVVDGDASDARLENIALRRASIALLEARYDVSYEGRKVIGIASRMKKS